MKILYVLENSPGSEAGLREGDLLHSVNGRLASEISQEELHRLMRTEGAEIKMRLIREGREMDVTLHLRRLV